MTQIKPKTIKRMFAASALLLTTACGNSPNMAYNGGNHPPLPSYDAFDDALFEQQTPQAIAEPYSYTKDMVDYYGTEPYGTILINIEDKYLYIVNGGGTAMRYPIAVGRAGKQDYDGEYVVSRKVEGPSWKPTAEMVAENPNLEQKTYGPGPNNPLGTHAVYFDFVSGGDSLLRAHGTNAPDSIGKEASSGCFRMYNAHAMDLYYRADIGTKVKTFTTAGMTPGIRPSVERAATYTAIQPVATEASPRAAEPEFKGIGFLRRTF